jgi:hypothetical protein
MKPNFSNILAILFVAFSFPFFVWVIYQSYKGHTESNYTSQVLTAIIAIDMAIFNFYFGSSQSSRNKDETIKTLATPTPPIKAEVVNTENIETVNTDQVTN